MTAQPDLTVVSGALSFHGQLPLGGAGFIIDPDGFEGFDDGVASKSSTISRPNAHGDFDVPSYLESRIVSLSGTCIAPQPLDLANFGTALTGFLADGPAPVTFHHMGRVLWGIARRAPGTAPKFKINGRTGTDARFQVQLKFADPRLFGEEQISPASDAANVATLSNYGNFTATPVYVVSGARAGGYTIAIDGKTFSVTKPLVAGSPHMVTMADGLLRINGDIAYGTFGSTWGVPAGATVVANTNAPSLSGSLYDTFV